jgi:hypothetical protein
MKKIARALAAAGLSVGTLFVMVSPASAHVHAFTPLGCLTTDNANSGAVVGFQQASDQAEPLNGPTGIIPRNASGKLPSGGQGAENACG